MVQPMPSDLGCRVLEVFQVTVVCQMRVAAMNRERVGGAGRRGTGDVSPGVVQDTPCVEPVYHVLK